ncbi:MAG: hypothetical protein FWF22_09665 [Treponema sp.]|nr:hypothetical protein [Treponema sp.]
MNIHGCDCSIVIKTTDREMDVPYSEETLREAVSLLVEEASIEGDGVSRAIRKSCGTTGCVVTPLTIGTAPLLLYLAFGSMGLPVYVSETRNVYTFHLNLVPMEDTGLFDLVQDRGGERVLYESCRVKGFELRFDRDETVKLKLDISGDYPPFVYPYKDTFKPETGERFYGDCVSYKINGQEYTNIYGLTLLTKKEGETKTELWIKRVLEGGPDLPHIIDEMTITAQLLRDTYEYRYFGMFRLTLKRLALTSDETHIDSSGPVIGPLRYYVADTVTAETFTSPDGSMG